MGEWGRLREGLVQDSLSQGPTCLQKEVGREFFSEQEGGLLEVFWGQNRKRIMGQGDTQMIVLQPRAERLSWALFIFKTEP